MPVLDTPGASYNVGYLLDRTFDLLLGSEREQMNQLGTAIEATATTLSLRYALGTLQRGTYIAVDTEVMYVWNAVTSAGGNTQATVQRGMKGTTAASHSEGAVVYINPYFTRYQVRQTLQDEIRSWAPQVFAVKTADLTATDFVRGYDMGDLGAWLFVIDVLVSPDTLLGTPSDKNWRSVDYRIDRSADTTTFPSGSALTVTSPLGIFNTPRTIHVVYGAPIDVDSTFTDGDTLLAMGMDSSDLDIAPYGAAWRLAASREVRRMLTEAQGNDADLQNFPPGYMVKAAQEFKMLRDSRLADAVARLRAQYPVRRAA